MLIEYSDFKPDGLLWHYTSWKAMTEIVKDKKIWASNISYLNDARELRIGLDQIYKAIENSNLPEDAKNKGLETVDAMLELGICVTSFSKSYDSLSQWRAYANGYPGVALGFCHEELGKLAHKSMAVVEDPPSEHAISYQLAECVYRPESQQSKVQHSLGHWMNRTSISRQGMTREEYLNFRAKYFKENMWGMSFFKHESFLEENEWRFATHRTGNDCLWEFHQSKSMVVPHVSIRLEDDKTSDGIGKVSFPLRAVSIGPNPHMELATKAAELFLKKHGLGDSVNVVASKAPYRSW